MKIEQIRKNILSKDLNISHLSKETGISRSNIYDIRNGVRDLDKLSLKTIKLLEHYFEIRKPVFKFEIEKELEALVVKDKTSKKVIKLSSLDEKVFLEEVACDGNLLIVSARNENEIKRVYAVELYEMLKHSKVLTRKNKKEDWHVASVQELQDAGMNVY